MPKHQLDFSKPPVLPDTLEESHTLILKLWDVIAELQAWKEELEEQLRAGSDNSSAPPSQDSLKKRAERKRKSTTGRKKGAQTGHRKHERALLPKDKVNTIKHYYPDAQYPCGEVVRLDGYRRHQVFDLPIEDLLSEQWGLQFSLGVISQSQEKLNDWLQIGDVVRQADLGYADETRRYRNRSTTGSGHSQPGRRLIL